MFPSEPSLHGILFALVSGLVDENETLEAAALRELKEETGYIADIKHVSPRKYFCLYCSIILLYRCTTFSM
jgi:8-oxo-dGTP pyrophosphatase MutT (NUDIX family)